MASKFNYKEDLSVRIVLVRLAIVLASVMAIVWVMPRDNKLEFNVEVNKVWGYADLTAPYAFNVIKPEATLKHEADSVRNTFQPYFNYDKEVGQVMVKRLHAFFRNDTVSVPLAGVNVIANRLTEAYRGGIMGSAEYGELSVDTARMVRVVSDRRARSVSIASVKSAKMVYESIIGDPALANYRQSLTHCNLNDFITPNLVYDTERNEESLNEEIALLPRVFGEVQSGEKIIDRGEVVTQDKYLKIQSLMIEENSKESDDWGMHLTTIGNFIFLFILMTCFTVYLSMFRKDYFDNPRNIAMLYVMIVLFSVVTGLMVRHTVAHVFIVPYALAPIFIRIFLDTRTAFMTSFTTILICACMLQHQFDFIVIETLAALIAIYSLRDLQYRSQLFRMAVWVTLIACLMQFALDLMTMQRVADIEFHNYNYLMVSGVLLLFAYPMLYLMEKMFGFTSNITLIELSNTNNDLLRRMSEVAPGTFQHSIQVGNLAAEVANKIGANSQLVRTGALYHDIGKLSNPIYFTENNQTGISPHDHLSYIDSARIIISHVSEGVKMAEKNSLPNVIKEFIQTHHGAGKAKYFYIKYKNEHPDEFVDELMFTYPGRNPYTREQAILMMADSVEAASRSLPDYTEASIRDLVNKIVDGQQADGFFKECPITFRDIAWAKTVMIERLKTMYHTRVAYPKEKA